MKLQKYNSFKSQNKIKHLLLCASLLLPGLLTTGCGQMAEYSKTGIYFDTVISVTLYGEDQKYLDDCMELASKYESYFSNTIDDSDVSRINSSKGSPVTVHEETAELIQKGLDYGKITNGKFDITIGGLSDLWDFSDQVKEGTTNIPSSEAIASALSTVDYSQVTVNGNQVTLSGNGRLDLGGIAKGYIADQMKEYLLSEGVTSGIINLGGNIVLIGPKPGNDSNYTIGIQEPFSDSGQVAVAIQMSQGSMVTSGCYERYFKVNDKIYHHLLDTDTGYPIDNELYSVTILNDSSTDGDALSTYVYSLGLKDGMAYVESLNDTEAVFITSDGQIHLTSGMGSRIKYTIVE